MSSSLYAITILLAAVATPVAAQTGVIQGRVLDGTKQDPIEYAAVLVVGTGISHLTDSTGNFRLLNVPVGEHTVRVTSIDYSKMDYTVSVSVGQVVNINFELIAITVWLDEVVVTGVGAETARRALGTSVEVLSAEDIELAPVQSVDQLLQGRISGATVSATSAQPGTGALISFRGTSSVFGAQTPVIYVDGVRVDNDYATAAGTGGEQSSALADLLTSDVERIEVTKGGAASTLFGSDAATGVIQIFTKKGTIGAPQATARIELGVELPELWNILDMGLIFPERVESREIGEAFLSDLYFKHGVTQNYYLGVTGGRSDVTYSVSGRLEDRTGTQPNDGSTNYNLRGGLQASIAGNFTLEFSGSYVRHNFDRLYNGQSIGDPLTAFEVGDALFISGASTLHEALDIFLLPDITESVNRFIFSTGARWDIRNDLTAKLNVGADNRTNQQRRHEPIGFTPGEPKGELNRWDRSFTSVSMDAGVTYSRGNPFGALASQLTVGVQGFREEESIINAQGQEFGLPGSYDFDDAATITATEENIELFNGGLYVDGRLSLWDKLYLGGGFRIDAGSSFGDNIDTELYPKATVSYILSEGLGVPFIGELKVRAAFGQTGKFPGPFLKDRTFSAISFRGESAPRFANPGNLDLKPEKTSTIEVGMDAALWSNRIRFNGTIYNARTTDALFQVPRQPVTGLDIQQENVGAISNRGVEVVLQVQVVNSQKLAWSIGGILNYNQNKVTDMGGVADFFVGGGKRVSEGRPVGAWWLTTPVDTNGDGLADGSEHRFTGTAPSPSRSGAVNTTISVGKSLTISSLADWAGGHEVFDWGSVWATFNGIYRRELIRCGTEAGASDGCTYAFPIQYRTDGSVHGKYSQGAARSAFLYDGGYFKIREISVRYILPESIANIINAKRTILYATGRNLWIWSRNRLVDGELNGVSGGGGLELGSESSITLSPNRAFKFGIEVVF